MYLRLRGCWKVLDGITQKEEIKDYDARSEEALTIIGLTVHPSQYSIIRDCKDGPSAWKALAETYEKPSRANRLALKRQLYTYTQDEESQTVQIYIRTILDLVDKLRNIGVKMDDDDVVDVLLMNAHLRFHSVVTSLSTNEHLTSKQVAGALLDEESRQNNGALISGDPNVAMFGQQRTVKGRIRKRTCYHCGKEGHMSWECPDKKKDGNTEQEEKSQYVSRISTELADVSY
jgi:hypothetical protein